MKRNELFEKCVANVNPETRAEVERNIALSEEFWKEWSATTEIPAPIDAILWGMRKQKQIDFGKIDDDCEGCDLCRKVYQEKFIDKADKWLRAHLPRVIENYPRSNGTTDMLNEDMRAEFRKAMEK